jgi:CheY-like chemotaxis protein
MTIDFEFLDSFERKRILLVDDDPFILGVLEKLLGLLGLETILQAGDGEQALALLKDTAVDLLITDVLMPNLDGLSLLKKIRSGQSSAAASLPCIVVSSWMTRRPLQRLWRWL